MPIGACSNAEPEALLGLEQLGLGPAPFGHVARVHDHAFDGGIVDEVGADGLEHA